MNKSYRTTLIGHEKNSKKGTPCFILLMILTWFISQFFTISGITGIQSQTSFQKDYIISNMGEFLAMRIDIPSSHPPNQTGRFQSCNSCGEPDKFIQYSSNKAY